MVIVHRAPNSFSNSTYIIRYHIIYAISHKLKVRNCVISHKMGRIGKMILGPMYSTHIWDIVLVNTILKNLWYFISHMVKTPN